MTTVVLKNAIYPCAPAVSTAGGEIIENIKNELGLTIQVIDFFLSKIGINLVDAIIEKLSGDFNAVDEIRMNFGSLGLALGAVGDNYATLGSALPATWSGGTASVAAQARLTSVARAHGVQSEAAALISEQIGAMMTCIEEAAKLAATLIGMVVDWVCSVPLLKLAKMLATGAKAIVQAITTIKRAIELIDNLRNVILPMMKALAMMATMLKALRIGVMMPAAVTTAATPANKVDDVAGAGF